MAMHADTNPIMEYRLFYSWQSDLPPKDNRNFIEKAIEIARKRVEQETGHAVVVDQATREVPGSPEIAASIEDKVKNCDLFIGDVSIINHEARDERKTPNPNVLFELGIATQCCTWDSVTMVLNEYYGDVDTLPFDIRHRRSMKYAMSVPQQANRPDIRNNLVAELYEAIRVMVMNPPKLRLQEIAKHLEHSVWEAFNYINGKLEEQEVKGVVRIERLHRNNFSFAFESWEHNQRFENGDWQARFFVNEPILTSADLAFVSSVDFDFKRLIFPLDRKYDRIYVIGTPPVYGKQVLLRKK